MRQFDSVPRHQIKTGGYPHWITPLLFFRWDLAGEYFQNFVNPSNCKYPCVVFSLECPSRWLISNRLFPLFAQTLALRCLRQCQLQGFCPSPLIFFLRNLGDFEYSNDKSTHSVQYAKIQFSAAIKTHNQGHLQ